MRQAPSFISTALEKSTRTYYLGFARRLRVWSRDISSLDPGSEEVQTAEWGGSTGISGRFGRAIAEAMNEERA